MSYSMLRDPVMGNFVTARPWNPHSWPDVILDISVNVFFFFQRLVFKSGILESNGLPSTTWVGLMPTAEGFHRKRPSTPKEEGIWPADWIRQPPQSLKPSP